MTETNKSETSPAIQPRAGLMRGVRLWADPDGILESPFMEQGMQMGYIYVYGEESPAVFDGTTWHSVVADNEPVSPDTIAAQYHKVIEHAESNKEYEELAQYILGAKVA